MLGTSFAELVLVRVGTIALSAITPACALCAILSFAGFVNFPLLLTTYFWAETLFYVCWYLPWKRRLEKPAIHPPQRPHNERQALVNQCLSTITAPEQYLSGWFHGATVSSIHRENLAEFLSWAFLDLDQVPPRGSEEAAEVDAYVRQFEEMLGTTLRSGYNPLVKSLRLTLDPVKMMHRSLVLYGVVGLVDFFTTMRLRMGGLILFPTKSWRASFPIRLHAVLASDWGKRSPSKDFSYWYRPHTAKDKVPIVFLHGLGIGLHPYVGFLHELAKEAGEGVGIVAVEIMALSMRICRDPMRASEFSSQMLQILNHHNITKFVLAGHSYGTVISTHLLHCPIIGPRIDSLVLIDPITFLLHLPNVAYNFTCRVPRSANQVQLDYFAAKDPAISHTICRHFFWRENILWKEELRGRKCAVVLSGRDLLVDSESVWEYLTEGQAQEMDVFSREDAAKREELTVLWYGDLDHAQVFERRKRRERLVVTVARFAKAQV
ncbi:hypothetical protein FN846DRAFT_782440 [Sphaerosporella brunnea]|uniref:AB hydrolase-1 domain-containing protein n=1 Tax=Sphaerosporella brunnea TaxID=1250544 RepID=A0A5J5EQ71_9PEZI|nr:hypothetical protein FN846DRAFT_782440 [Sphaerosporella brunnea]